jgi:hypothetical protein
LAELVKIVGVTGRSTNHCPNSRLFHFFKHNQCPAFIITNRLPIARRLPCIDQLIGATTILTYWPLSVQVLQALLKRTGNPIFRKHSQLFELIQSLPELILIQTPSISVAAFDAALYGLKNDFSMTSSLTDRIFHTAFEGLQSRGRSAVL